mgnify:CR=1 FL=1
MNGIKNFAISFIVSLIIFGLISFIIVKLAWPSTKRTVKMSSSDTKVSDTVTTPTE